MIYFSPNRISTHGPEAKRRDLKLDGSAFDKCPDFGEKSEGIHAVVNEATALGIQGGTDVLHQRSVFERLCKLRFTPADCR